MDNRSDRDILIGTATKVEAIEADIKEINETLRGAFTTMVGHSVELGKLKNNPERIRSLEEFKANITGKYAVWAGFVMLAVGGIFWLLRQ